MLDTLLHSQQQFQHLFQIQNEKIKQLELSNEKLVAQLEQQQQRPHEGARPTDFQGKVIATSCSQLYTSGHRISGLYLVQKSAKIATVNCDFTQSEPSNRILNIFSTEFRIISTIIGRLRDVYWIQRCQIDSGCFLRPAFDDISNSRYCNHLRRSRFQPWKRPQYRNWGLHCASWWHLLFLLQSTWQRCR